MIVINFFIMLLAVLFMVVIVIQLVRTLCAVYAWYQRDNQHARILKGFGVTLPQVIFELWFPFL